jgi:hypothetical protein
VADISQFFDKQYEQQEVNDLAEHPWTRFRVSAKATRTL